MNPLIVEGLTQAIAKFVPALMVFLIAVPQLPKYALPRIIASAFAVAAAVLSARDFSSHRLFWLLIAGGCLIQLVLSIRIWLRQNNARLLTDSLSLILVLMSFWAIAGSSGRSFESLQALENAVGIVVAFGIPILQGYSLAFAAQATLSMTPEDREKGAERSGLRLIFFAACGALAVAGMYLVLTPVDSSPTGQIVAAKLLGFTLMVLAFSCWLLCQRLHRHDSAGKTVKPSKDDSAASLAIAAWIIVMTIAVGSAIPLGWPWNLPS